MLGVGSVLPIVTMFISNLEFLIVVALICFLLGRFALGIQAIRLDAPPAEARPA